MIRLIGLLLLIIIQSCSQQTQDVNQDAPRPLPQTASFNLGSVTSSSTHVKSYVQLWRDIHSLKQFQFKTCLKDIAILQAIVGQPFELKGPIHRKFLETDVDGCLQWTYDLAYNTLNPETYTEYKFEVIGAGVFKGSVSITLFLNPWTGDVLDGRVHNTQHISKLSPAQMSQAKMLNEGPSLGLENLKMTFENETLDIQSKTRKMTYSFELTPYLQRPNINSQLEKQKLNDGQFTLSLSLIQSKNGDRYLISQKTLKKQFIKAQKIFGETQIELPAWLERTHDSDELQLLVELTPTEAPSNLTSFCTEVPIEDLRLIHMNQTYSHKEGCPTLRHQLKSLTKLDSRDLDFGYTIKKMGLKWGGNLTEDYGRSAQKVWHGELNICLQDGLNFSKNKPLINHDFKIELEFMDGTKDPYTEERVYRAVDASGCDNIALWVPYNIYKSYEWKQIKVKFIPQSYKYKNINQERVIAVNPGNPKDYFRDLKFESLPKIDSSKPQAEILVESFRLDHLHNNNNSYQLNSKLHLKFNKMYQIEIRPTYNLLQHSDNETSASPIRLGRFKVDFYATQTKLSTLNYDHPELSDLNLIAQTSFETKVDSQGLLRHQIELPIKVSQLGQLITPTIGLLKLTPLDDFIPLEANSFVVKLNLLGKNLKNNLTPLDSEQETLLNDWKTQQESLGPQFKLALEDSYKNYKNYIKSNFPNKIQFHDLKSYNQSPQLEQFKRRRRSPSVHLTPTDFQKLIQLNLQSPQLAKKICYMFYDRPTGFRGILSDENKNFMNCLKSPLTSIAIKRVHHIKPPDDANPIITATYQGSDKGTLRRGYAFFASGGHRSDYAKGVSRSASVKAGVSAGLGSALAVPFSFFASLGAEVSRERFRTEQDAHMQAAFSRQYTDIMKRPMDVNILRLKFKALAKTCVLMTTIKKNDHDRQVHLCNDDYKLKSLEDQWYFIGNINQADAQILDDGNIIENQDNRVIVIRGTDNFYQYWNNFEKEDTTLMIQKLQGHEASEALHQITDRANQFNQIDNFLDNSFPATIFESSADF